MTTELNSNQKAIISALAYSDVFDFPLTKEELWHDLVSSHKISKDILNESLEKLNEIIVSSNGFFCLKGREKIIKNRIRRSKLLHAKFKIAQKASLYLSYIPSIYFIGITGKVGHNDTTINDDVDFMFITKKNTIWTTRFLILAVLEFLNLRRTSFDKNSKNKICPNLILDETGMHWAKDKQDIYVANEITHIRPLFDRKNTFQKFIKSNRWIYKYYANSDYKSSSYNFTKPKNYLALKLISRIINNPLFEFIFGTLQKKYMQNKITNETIKSNFLAFHPSDCRPKTLSSFKAKLKKYGICQDHLEMSSFLQFRNVAFLS